ncbi:hypothetical protein DOY81_009080 [Sarcophaga bullata]|nr:hypothetical protein DOY81_009080 [Sarcophaga bullata]
MHTTYTSELPRFEVHGLNTWTLLKTQFNKYNLQIEDASNMVNSFITNEPPSPKYLKQLLFRHNAVQLLFLLGNRVRLCNQLNHQPVIK